MRALGALCSALLFQPWLSSAWAEDEVVLTARPGLCVLKDATTKECVMGVRLDWRGPQGDYCLHQAGVEEPLACWQQQARGGHDAALASAEDVVYRLRRVPSDYPVAQISVRVLSLAQRHPSRHRRRHAWAPL